MRIFIGYDESAASDEIIGDLQNAGLPQDCEVKIATVAELAAESPKIELAAVQTVSSGRMGSAIKRIDSHTERVTRAAKETAERAADSISSYFPDWKINTEVLTGSPAWELIDEAEMWNADLVVVGSQDRSMLGRLLLGSVSKTVVTDSRRSVRVSRPGLRTNEKLPPQIIVGIDGSTASQEAVNAIGKRAWKYGTHVRLVAVQDHTSSAKISTRHPRTAEIVTDSNDGRIAKQRQMLDWAVYQLRTIGLNVSISIQRGDPKRILLKEALKYKADSIFVGTREFKDAIERFRLGSVSTGVVTNAACSVEVVRTLDAAE